VDLEAGRIRVRRNFVCGEFGTPKSRRSSRSVPMTPGLKEWMGHRDLTTTQIYADYAPNAAESEMVARAFGR
jgi:hypothetical protein